MQWSGVTDRREPLETCWKASKWLPDRLDWAEPIWARLEVDRVQTAAQISLPSVRVVVATPSGTASWMTPMTLLETVLSWFLPLSLECWCILTATVTLPDHSAVFCVRMFSQRFFNFLPSWQYPAEWRLAREPRVAAAPQHWWHMHSLGDTVSEKLWLQSCRPVPGLAYRLKKNMFLLWNKIWGV